MIRYMQVCILYLLWETHCRFLKNIYFITFFVSASYYYNYLQTSIPKCIERAFKKFKNIEIVIADIVSFICFPYKDIKILLIFHTNDMMLVSITCYFFYRYNNLNESH